MTSGRFSVPARANAVAQQTNEKAHQHGDGDRSNGEIADLRLGQMKFLADDRHQWRDAEPSKETQKKRQPRHVEGAHRST